MKKLKIIIFVFIALISGAILSLSASAEDAQAGLPNEYYEMLDSLPEDASDRLPEEFWSGEAEEVGEAVSRFVSPEGIFSFIGELLGDGISSAVRTLAMLSAVLILCALFSALSKSVGGSALSGTMDFCSACAIFGILAVTVYSQIELLSSYFERINSLILSFIPVMGTALAMGGGVTTAATGSSGMYAFLAFSENFCAGTASSVSATLAALALCRGLAPSINLGGVASGLKKSYVFILGFIMTLLLAILASSTALSASADTVAARAAKMVASSVIPVVGGSVSDTLRTVSASAQYIKSVCGVGGIVAILILALPTLISLLLMKLALMIAGSIANILGCEKEGRLIEDLGGVLGLMSGVCAMTGVMFILAVSLFVRVTF